MGTGYSTVKLSVKPAQMKPYDFSPAREALQGDSICAKRRLTSLESRHQSLEAKCFRFSSSLSSTIPTDLQASGYMDILMDA